ncbi:MAG: hypothetical protein ACXWDO_12155 [Bacteroidia bacterium]
MKTLLYSLTILLTTIFVVPEITAAETTASAMETTAYGDGVKHSRKFKTHKGNKRGKHTCLRKGGCKPKLRNSGKSKCGGYM